MVQFAHSSDDPAELGTFTSEDAAMFPSFRRFARALAARLTPINQSKLRGNRRCRPMLEILEGRLTPTVIHWTDLGHDGVWENPLNWDTGTVPGAADDASIGSSAYSIVDHLAETAVHSIACMVPIAFNGDFGIAAFSSITPMMGGVAFYGQLTLGGTLYLSPMMGGSLFNDNVHIAAGAELQLAMGGAGSTVSGGVIFDGAGVVKNMSTTLALYGDASFTNLDMVYSSAKMTGSGTATILNRMRFQAGQLQGSGTLAVVGELDFEQSSDKTITGWTIENAGTTNWTGGNIISTAATFTNSGMFSAGNPMAPTLTWYDGQSTFNNLGTFVSSSMQVTVNMVFNSTNLVHVTSGVLNLNVGGTLGDTLTVDANSNLALGGGIFALLGGLQGQGDGTVRQQGADSIVTGTATMRNYDLVAGALRGTGTLAITHLMNWTGGEMREAGSTEIQQGTLVINGATLLQDTRSLVNRATIQWRQATWDLRSATVDNRGTLIASTNGTHVLEWGGFGSRGTFHNNLGVVTSQCPMLQITFTNFNNDGVVELTTGEMQLYAAGGTHTGYFDTSSGATCHFTGISTHRLDPQVSDTSNFMLRGEGWYRVDGLAEINLPSAVRVLANNFELASGGGGR